MSKVITYGEGGYCEPCDETHDHPLNNIVEIVEIVEEPEPTEEELARQSAIDKLTSLGLTEVEVSALLQSGMS